MKLAEISRMRSGLHFFTLPLCRNWLNGKPRISQSASSLFSMEWPPCFPEAKREWPTFSTVGWRAWQQDKSCQGRKRERLPTAFATVPFFCPGRDLACWVTRGPSDQSLGYSRSSLAGLDEPRIRFRPTTLGCTGQETLTWAQLDFGVPSALIRPRKTPRRSGTHSGNAAAP